MAVDQKKIFDAIKRLEESVDRALNKLAEAIDPAADAAAQQALDGLAAEVNAKADAVDKAVPPPPAEPPIGSVPAP